MLQGGDLINIDITREDKEINYDDDDRRVVFDTAIEIGKQRHVIKDTNLSALENCPETFYCEKLDLVLSLGWKSDPNPGNEHEDSYYPRYDGEFKYVKGQYIVSFN